MKRAAVIAAIVLLFAAGLAAQAAPPKTVADKAGRLLDVRTGEVIRNAVILVEDGVIKAVGPNVAVSARELVDAVEIAPDALSALAEERARNVKTYLVETGKVEPQRITESPRGGGSNGSRVYLRLQ